MMKNENHEFVKDLLKIGSEQWIAKDVEYTTCIVGIINDLQDGNAIAVINSSFKDQYSSATWVIENEDSSERILRNIEVPGFPVHHNDYRSKVTGLYAITRIVSLIVKNGISNSEQWESLSDVTDQVH